MLVVGTEERMIVAKVLCRMWSLTAANELRDQSLSSLQGMLLLLLSSPSSATLTLVVRSNKVGSMVAVLTCRRYSRVRCGVLVIRNVI